MAPLGALSQAWVSAEASLPLVYASGHGAMGVPGPAATQRSAARAAGLDYRMMAVARSAATVVMAVLLVACASTHGLRTPAESQSPASRAITGSFLIQALPGEGFTDLGDGTCVGSGKYRDIAPGTPVRVTTDTRVDTDQSDGQLLGDGQLGEGVTPPDEFHPVGCKFLFEVTDLPDLDRYVLEVGETGQTFLSLAALEEDDWHVDLTVNDCTASNPCNY